MDALFSVHAIVPFLTLCALELVLGIDNVIFISILSGKLPKDQQQKARTLGLSFLLLIGVTLIAEGFHQHISKGYIYFAMAFSLFVEVLNIRLKKKSDPLHLKKTW